jgi:glycosyltransferase involved in cell wall biosynthesis
MDPRYGNRMRALIFGTYDSSVHPRIGIVGEGLREHGFDVVECNEPLGLNTAARVRLLAQPWRLPALLGRLAGKWAKLAWRASRTPAPDVIVVGYLGHFDVHLARLLFRRTPIVLDHMVSASGTGQDRGLDGGPRKALLRMIDGGALRNADIVMVDTQEHLESLPERYQGRAVVVPVGAPSNWFRAAAPAAGVSSPGTADGPLRVVFYGLFTPLQGAPVIGEALGLLSRDDADIEVTMIGTGQDYEVARAAAGNGRVQWIDWVPPDELPALVGGHDVCLGIFGTGDKARRVIPNKVYQGAAVGCAIVTSDTPPQRRVLGDAAVLVPPGDAKSLADALRELAANPREYKRRAHDLAEQSFTPRNVSAPLVAALNSSFSKLP